MINQELVMERLSEVAFVDWMVIAVLAALILLTMLDIAGVVDVNKWGWRGRSRREKNEER
tara:strand:- start:1441 stop:1620 length:180 start_codon:yes stop_codon:yes gene_type:complete